MRKETGYFWSNIYTHTIMQNSPSDVGNGGSRQGEKLVTSIVKYI